MGRKLLSKITIFLITTIIILLILSKLTKLSIKGFSLWEIAGLTSIIIGIFGFIKDKILSKKNKLSHILFQISTIILGVIILIPKIYLFLKSKNYLIDSILIGIYILILFIFALMTKDEYVGNGEIREAESMLGTDFKDNLKFKRMKKKFRY